MSLRGCLYTARRPITLALQVHAITPGIDCFVILGLVTIGRLGIDFDAQIDPHCPRLSRVRGR